MKEEDIQLHSDEVNEIFSKMPSHMVRWGNTWILLVLLSLLGLAFYVKYPDVITGNATLTTLSAPVIMVATNNGKISLLTENYATVSQGQLIAFINEETKLADMDTLYHYLQNHELETMHPDSLKTLALGKLQTSWSRFIVDLQSYQVYHSTHPEQVGISSSTRQMQNNQKSVISLKEQIKIKEDQLNFYQRKLEKDRLLLQKGMIAERDVQNTEMQLSEMQNQIKSLYAQLISIDKNNADYQKQIADYQIAQTQKESEKLTALKQQRITLLEEIELWYKSNTFKSPIDGKLQYNIPITENQFIAQGQELFTITPEKKQDIQCNLSVPMSGMGKVEIGQKVILRLQHYPEEEYGVLYGKVQEISPSPIVSKTAQGDAKIYLIKVRLDNGLWTSYKKEIIYKANMEGSGDIITKDKSFLERIFEQLLKLIKR